MAGTWEQAMPATILATLVVLLCSVFVSVTLRRTASRQHHLRIDFLGYAGHHAGHVLEGESVAKCDLDGVVNVAADLQHAEPVALQDRPALLGGQCKAVQVCACVVLEAFAVLRLVERHAEHVERVPFAAAARIVDIGAGNAFVVAWLFHARISADRISWRTMSRTRSMALRISGLFGRRVDVAIDNEVFKVGERIGFARTSSAHSVDLTAFKGSTAEANCCR